MHDPQKAEKMVAKLLDSLVTGARVVIEAEVEDGEQPVMPQLPGEDDVEFQKRRLTFIQANDRVTAKETTA